MTKYIVCCFIQNYWFLHQHIAIHKQTWRKKVADSFQSTVLNNTTGQTEELVHKRGTTSVAWTSFGSKNADVVQTVVCKVCQIHTWYFKRNLGGVTFIYHFKLHIHIAILYQLFRTWINRKIALVWSLSLLGHKMSYIRIQNVGHIAQP